MLLGLEVLVCVDFMRHVVLCDLWFGFCYYWFLFRVDVSGGYFPCLLVVSSSARILRSEIGNCCISWEQIWSHWFLVNFYKSSHKNYAWKIRIKTLLQPLLPKLCYIQKRGYDVRNTFGTCCKGSIFGRIN